MSEQAQTVDFEDFYDLLGHSSVTVCVGPRGSGKTALAALVSGQYFTHDINVVWFTMVNVKHLIPKQFKNINARSPRWIPDTLTVMDDIHLEYHAREWRMDKSIVFDKIMSLSRQNNQSFFITTQHSARADISVFRDADNLLIKKPNKKQIKFDRTQMKPFLEAAQKAFKGVKNPKKWVYASTKDDYEGLIGPYDLPKFWSEELSKYMGKRRRRRN